MTIIADAIFHFIKRHLQTQGQRQFFRVDGFDEESYEQLLTRLQKDNFQVGAYGLLVRSTGVIPGFESLAVEKDKSATWYRNHVAAHQALVLLFNRPTSDAQSLKDLYSITESTLAREGFEDLLVETFDPDDYTLSVESKEVLSGFLARLERTLHFQPQLRDLADFLHDVKGALMQEPGRSMEDAIAESLPALGLFRCRRWGTVTDRNKGDRLLREVWNASRLGAELLDDRVVRDYRSRLEQEKVHFTDESSNSLSPVKKAELLEQFLTQVVRTAAARRQIFSIDWDEVEHIFQKRPPSSNKKVLPQLADDIQKQLAQQEIQPEDLPPSMQGMLQGMASNQTPAEEDIAHFLDDYSDLLPFPVRKSLRSLVSRKPIKHTDFLVALMQAVVVASGMATASGKYVAFRLQAEEITVAPDDRKTRDALRTFQVLYGGIEGAMPGITWDLAPLWQALAQADDPNQHEVVDDDKRLVSGKVELFFTLRPVGTDGKRTADRAIDVVWVYTVDGPAAMSLENLLAEHQRLIIELPANRIPIPLYHTTLAATTIADLDLSRPLRSIGAWYDNPPDLLSQLRADLAQQTTAETQSVLEKAVLRLERTWARFVETTLKAGLLAAPLAELLHAYQKLIDIAGERLQADQEHVPGLRAINRAWLVGSSPFGDWAIVPFVHPFKLQWWQSRVHAFNVLIQRLCDTQQPASVIDQDRLLQEIGVAYSSANMPAVLALPYLGTTLDFYLPVQELAGYELYRIGHRASIAHGFDPELTSLDESDLAVKQAASALAAVIEDYLETYPFVRDGLEIYIINCRNGSLPGALVEQISRRMERGKTMPRLNVIVHTDRGAPIHERVTQWLEVHEEYQTRLEETYFPRISLKVRHCSFDDLVQSVEDTDMVILPDVIAERGQHVEIRAATTSHAASTDSHYLSLYGVSQAPHQQREFTRDIVLTPADATQLHQSFYRLQDATKRRQRMVDHPVEVVQRATLQDWRKELEALHTTFNWVICYDSIVDRFLLEATFPQAVDVIRYSLGLGPKRRHKLTVSSSNKTRDQVQRRLTGSLKTMFSSMSHLQQLELAKQLITRANTISGDIVLRAAGPGVFLNELIGMVSACYEVERAHVVTAPHALRTWIYLEDFSQWFKKRLPDLLFIAISPGSKEAVRLDIQVIETKCVSQTSFPTEAREAREQARHGLSRLEQVWKPGSDHLDAAYWYDQLYQALVGTVSLSPDWLPLWQQARQAIPSGRFELNISAHAWVFCHDGGLDSGLLVEHEESESADGESLIHAHHVGKEGLRKLLYNLIGQPFTIESPPVAPIYETDASAQPVQASPSASEVLADIDVISARQHTPTTQDITETTGAPIPALDSLEPVASKVETQDELADWMKAKGHDIVRALRHYNIAINPLDITEADIGPSIVRFKLRLRPGQKLNQIETIAEDLQRELALLSVPLIGNVPGTNYIGLDVPRPRPDTIELLSSLSHLPPPEVGQMTLLVGVTPSGQFITRNLATMPHMLVAGTTGSGKTVFLYSVIVSLVHQFGPEQLELLLVDPKQTDFVFFEELPHLVGSKVILEPEEAIERLTSLLSVDLEQRTARLRDSRSRDIQAYNEANPTNPLKPIVVIIDEYADLVQVLAKAARQTFEGQLIRLAQRARNVGIHLVIATQRPSADVLTTTLKANLPARVAFRLPSHYDSQIVLDEPGAEKLIGKGDMLLHHEGLRMRLQGLFVRHQDLESWLADHPWQR